MPKCHEGLRGLAKDHKGAKKNHLAREKKGISVKSIFTLQVDPTFNPLGGLFTYHVSREGGEPNADEGVRVK